MVAMLCCRPGQTCSQSQLSTKIQHIGRMAKKISRLAAAVALSRGLNNILLFGFLICAGAVLLLISPEERQ
jgi:hypothetical protein